MACFDMMFLKTLTQFLPCAVTFTMDITGAALALQKEIKKIDIKLKDGSARSYQQIQQLRARRQALIVQLQAVLAQL